MKKICIVLSVAGVVAGLSAQIVSFKDAAKIKSWDALTSEGPLVG